MSTVGELADRTFREYLTLPDDQPVIVTLSSDVTAATTSISYTDDTLAPDEEDLLAPGVLIEIGVEQCRITAADDTANTLTVLRAVNGTTAAAHTAGAEITVAPSFARSNVVEAVKDNVVALYPSLWHEATETLTSSSSYVEVPAEVITPKSLVWQNGTRYQQAPLPQLLTNFPASSTGKAIQLYSVPSGRTMYFTYRGQFARPSTASSNLSTLGVDPTWERIVAVGAAAQVVAGRPSDRLTAEYLTEQLAREALPPGSATDIRNGLLTLRSVWLDEAARSLRADMPTPVTYAVAVR